MVMHRNLMTAPLVKPDGDGVGDVIDSCPGLGEFGSGDAVGYPL